MEVNLCLNERYWICWVNNSVKYHKSYVLSNISSTKFPLLSHSNVSNNSNVLILSKGKLDKTIQLVNIMCLTSYPVTWSTPRFILNWLFNLLPCTPLLYLIPKIYNLFLWYSHRTSVVDAPESLIYYYYSPNMS